jgi:hypothetical protein
LLARNAWSEDNAIQFHRAIYRVKWGASADLNAADLEVRSTFEKCRRGGNVTGIPKLKELIDHQVVNTICKWLHIHGTADVGWPEPILLADDQVDPLPINILPGTLGEYAQALSQFTETPAELPTLAVLGVMSAVAAAKAEVEAEPGYREPVNLYVCPILESGNRKTAVINGVTAPLVAHERRERERLAPEIARVKSELKTKQLAIEKLRKSIKLKDEAAIKQIVDLEQNLPIVPRAPTLFTSDATAERLEVLLADNDGRMALISDEGGPSDVMAGRYSAAPNLDIFLKGHCQAPLRVHRMERTTVIDRPHLTVLLSPQPGVLSDLRDKGFMRNRGLLARFLFAMPRSPVGNRSLEPIEMPSQTVAAYENLVTQILQWKPDAPVTLRLSKGAYQDWKEFQ